LCSKNGHHEWLFGSQGKKVIIQIGMWLLEVVVGGLIGDSSVIIYDICLWESIKKRSWLGKTGNEFDMT